ncbi:MAG: hypothetical protein AAGA72_18615 [Pseudomonadota bacterium]
MLTRAEEIAFATRVDIGDAARAFADERADLIEAAEDLGREIAKCVERLHRFNRHVTDKRADPYLMIDQALDDTLTDQALAWNEFNQGEDLNLNHFAYTACDQALKGAAA